MHLWPSARLRDSFKIGYLKNLEWNLNRMKSQKNNPSQTSKLLDDDNNSSEAAVAVDETPNSVDPKCCVAGALLICRELLMLVSCCYCCFCCGGMPFITVSPVDKKKITFTDF